MCRNVFNPQKGIVLKFYNLFKLVIERLAAVCSSLFNGYMYLPFPPTSWLQSAIPDAMTKNSVIQSFTRIDHVQGIIDLAPSLILPLPAVRANFPPISSELPSENHSYG